MCALQSGRPLPVYPCGQQDLYTIVETGWASYAQYLTDFSNLSTLYTASTGTNQLSAVASARSMPDEDSRDEVHMTLRVQLKDLADICLIKWMDMSTYIRDGFPENEYDNKRLAAGHGYYATAEHDDWDDVKGLMQNGVDFANANSAVLTTGGMPASFIADMTAAKDAFELKHQEFLQAEEDSKVLTDAKIEANNALYRALIKMFEDGKKIFRNNAAVREQFTFNSVWDLVRNPGSGTGPTPPTDAKLSGQIIDANTLTPMFEVAVTLTPTTASQPPITVLTDMDGRYSIENITPGGFDFLAERVGYASVTNSGTLTAGEDAIFDFQMQPVPTP